MSMTTWGMDVAKPVFQRHGVDTHGYVVLDVSTNLLHGFGHVNLQNISGRFILDT
jgi:hypothetical protein